MVNVAATIRLKKSVEEVEKEHESIVWAQMCSCPNLKESGEAQTQKRDDLLKNFRMWDVKDERELFKRMLAHPEESVCFQVFEMMESFGEKDNVTSLLESTVLV